MNRNAMNTANEIISEPKIGYFTAEYLQSSEIKLKIDDMMNFNEEQKT